MMPPKMPRFSNPTSTRASWAKRAVKVFTSGKKAGPEKDSGAAEGINLESLSEELMQPYFDECRACLADGIVEDQDAVDAGMIFGTGFAPFRGGPLFYLEQSTKGQEAQENE